MSWFRPVDRWLLNEVVPHQHAFQSLARRLTGSGEVAKDIVQDVYAEVLSGEGWRQAIDPKAFTMRIIYCRSVDWVNRQKIVPILAMPGYEGTFLADHGPDAFETLAGREELLVVLEILEDLPTRCRQVLTMRRIEDLPPREIARRLNINIATVEGHMARGLSLLSERLARRGTVRRLRANRDQPITSSGE